MNNLNDRFDDLGSRLDRIETKLDNHLERVTKAESDISWLRGHVKLATAIFLAIVGTLGTILLNMILPGE